MYQGLQALHNNVTDRQLTLDMVTWEQVQPWCVLLPGGLGCHRQVELRSTQGANLLGRKQLPPLSRTPTERQHVDVLLMDHRAALMARL